jgi:hypothetical protein
MAAPPGPLSLPFFPSGTQYTDKLRERIYFWLHFVARRRVTANMPFDELFFFSFFFLAGLRDQNKQNQHNFLILSLLNNVMCGWDSLELSDKGFEKREAIAS